MSGRTSHPLRRWSAAAILLAVLGAGCTIAEDAGPRLIPDEQRGQFGARPSGDVAAGSTHVFMIAPGSDDEQSKLRSVLRDVENDPEAIYESLFAGPNAAEQASGLSSVLPDELELLGARVRGRVLTIDVNDALQELTPDALRFAVAQIVITASEIDGVERVRLRIDGDNQAWPLGNAENTDRLLTPYDYPGFVESSQPPVPAFP